MQLASVRIKTHQFGDVPKFNVTPPELLALITAHDTGSGGTPFTDLKITGEDNRSKEKELARLLNTYPNLKHRSKQGQDVYTIEYLFRDNFATLPTKFEDLGAAFTDLPTGTITKPQNYIPDHGQADIDKAEAAQQAGSTDNVPTNVPPSTEPDPSPLRVNIFEEDK
jgi:hypothetical protein